MGLSMDQMMPGAVVVEMFDDANKLKRLKVARRGVIERVVSCAGEQYNDGSGIREIWVRFSRELPAEKVANARLALQRPYNPGLNYRTKQDAANALGDDILEEVVPESKDEVTILVDHTDLEQNESLHPITLEKKFPKIK